MISLNYIKSVHLRVLPNIIKQKTSLEVYKRLISDKDVVNFFKRDYKFQELPGIRAFLMRSTHYDGKFLDKLSSQLESSTSAFHRQLEECSSKFSVERIVTINKNDIDFFSLMLKKYVFKSSDRDAYLAFEPTSEDVFQKQNFSASSGLPSPWLKKRDLKIEMFKIISDFCKESLNIFELDRKCFRFSAAFKRQQVTNSGLKTRLVFAVNYAVALLEGYYDLWIKRIILHDNDCHFIHGRDQLYLSNLTKSTKGMHTYSFDAKFFDHNIPSIVMVLAFSVIEDILPLTNYKRKMLKFLRNYQCTLPLFHPLHPPMFRKRGLSSGSGLTSTLGSINMFFMHCVTFRRYQKRRGIDLTESNLPLIYVSSDDSVISFTDALDHRSYIKEMYNVFGLELELECYSPPEGDEVFFLGSNWKSGLPRRNINRLFGRICFGSGNFPKMSNFELFSSRCYEILGNTSEFPLIWKSFNVGLFPRRVFRFVELMDWNNRQVLENRRTSNTAYIDKRGFWENLTAETEDIRLSDVWKTR